MIRTADGRSLTIIGENIHASRVVKRDGARVGTAPDGRAALRFADPDGSDRWLALPAAIVDSGPYADGKVKHVAAAILAGLEGGHDADDATAYVRWLVERQLGRDADYLDVNVDEVAPDPARQVEAARWVIGIVAAATTTPLSLDSSSSAVLEAGLDAIPTDATAPLLNSASVERPDVLDLAAARGASVVLSAAGAGAPPATTEAKVAAAEAILELATVRGLDPAACHVDPLVLPVAVEPDAGRAYLEAVAAIRARGDAGLHVTGGLSNVSFGLPARSLLNEVFIDLAVSAGADSGIVDPVAIDLDRALAPDRDAEAYRLASDALTGRDPYCGALLAAYRSGRLGGPAA